MTYLGFHAVFTLPVIAALALVPPRPLGGPERPARVRSLLLIVGIAFAYTTPWDNYLVFREVWGYPPDRVIGRIGYVPIEEYMFFVLQTILTGLWYFRLRTRALDDAPDESQRARWTGTAFFAGVTLCGVYCLVSGNPHALYMGLILAWAGPVLAFMWALGGHWIWRQRRTWFIAVAVPTVYLWIADRIAIGLGIWDISNAHSFDFDPLGLPIEEAVFFLVTNLMVVQGLLLFLHGVRLPGFSTPSYTASASG